MPTRRGTETLCDLIDHAIGVATSYRATVLVVIQDGVVSPEERHLLAAAEREVEQAHQALPGPASEADCAMVVIGAVAGAVRVSPHAYRKARESFQDSRRISA